MLASILLVPPVLDKVLAVPLLLESEPEVVSVGPLGLDDVPGLVPLMLDGVL